MKRKVLAMFSITIFTIMLAPMKTVTAQAPIQNNITGTDYPKDLWHLKNIGVGSSDRPYARVHIFNGKTNLFDPMARNTRPFLINGVNMIKKVLIDGTEVYSEEKKDYFTIDKQGYVGIDVLNPFTKLHLHQGVFTISDGPLAEPKRWEIHGTQNAFAIKDYNSSTYRFWINKSNGFVGIGTESPDEKLHVEDGNVLINNGDLIIQGQNPNFDSNNHNNQIRLKSDGYIRAREIKVDLQTIPDYVFDKDYELMSLDNLKKFIEEKKHLPNIKSEAEFQEEGSISLTEMNLKLLEKVEELTLYVLSIQAQIDEIKTK